MSRGLSKTQKAIIKILNYETEHNKKEWYNVSSLLYQIKNGVHCFESCDLPVEPSYVEKQSYWRAIRSLEKKRIIESRRKIANFEDMLMREGRGGISAVKEVRLSVESNSEMNCTKHLEVEKNE